MAELDDLLFEIFEELRQRRVPLGMSDYQLVMESLYELINVEDSESVKGFCRLFWAKSHEDQLLFDEIFDIKVKIRLQALYREERQRISSLSKKSSLTSPPTIPPSKPHLAKKQTQQGKQPRITPRMSPHLPSVMDVKRVRSPFSIGYYLTPRPPMDKRDMVSIWRKLRRNQREGPLEDLDIQATIDSLSRTGLPLQPVLQPRRRNQATLSLLIDQGGSMEPFALFIESFIESILRSGSLRSVSIFYFHDYPQGYLYTSPVLLGAKPIEGILLEHCQRSSVLIVSDAGAARGRYDSMRVRGTKEFLNQLNRHTYLYAWLNPVPQVRWRGTSAWNIAQLLPMFQLDWEGLNDVVNILRGQLPSEVWQL